MTINEISLHFKVKPGIVGQWVRRGLPVLRVGGRGIGYEIDLTDAVEWHRKFILGEATFEEFFADYDIEAALATLSNNKD